MATINWFPGHMKKTKREIQDNLKLVDAVIEIRDARIPRSSANPDIDKICAGKSRLILLNKSDLTESKVTKDWINELDNQIIQNKRKLLEGKGKISHQEAMEKAEKEFEIYRDREMKQLESDFDKMIKMLKDNNKNN